MKGSLIVSLVVSVLLGFSEAEAGTLYGTFGNPGAKLVVFDTDTFTWSEIGLIGVPENGNGLAYDPSSDTL